MFVLARIRGWFEGAGWALAVAGGLFFVALLVALLVAQSGSRLLWTGQAVTGREQGGLVYYQWQGKSYTLDVPGYASAKSVTLYLDPGNPSDAGVDSTTDRVATILGIGLPVLAGMAVLVIGGSRNYRWKRRNAKRGTGDFWISQIPR